jgi:2-polyprenyl-3-methyl-5-hydroxy-6-metoxy-1,4-benzoquinol methylase
MPKNSSRAVLDAKNVLSLDYSDYEQCDIVHDMNQTVDPSLHEKFDAVIDGGTLEHVFNFPVAISNCMKMVKVNGSIFIFTTANNFLGHGFYQFSPELFCRIFSPENGFEIRIWFSNNIVSREWS